MWEIKMEDIYQDAKKHSEHYDFTLKITFVTSNAKVPGVFKDESAGRPILEFVGVASKLYSFLAVRNNGKKWKLKKQKALKRFG